MAPTILLADTVTRLGGEHAGQVLVTGSHGGIIAAAYAAQARVRAAIFNDAGRGLDDAVLIMPTRRPRKGETAVRIGRFVG